jgi:hypothetical protein
MGAPTTTHASGPLGRVHVASACQAFGHRELFGVLRNFGLVLEPVVEAHT